ncbi:MAG: sulfatase-like hydrolase/transferase [Acidobacteriota bacterium]
MQRRDFLKSASMCGIGALIANDALSEGVAASAPAMPAVDRPNIVLVVSDQHRAGLTKREGYPLDTSPTLDKLASSGVGFDRAYCTAPLCVPSRTSMLTGRWPDATRVRSNEMIHDAVYETHLYAVAKQCGYRTGLAGKNHTFLRPEDTDFWREYGLQQGWMPPNPPQMYQDFQHWMKSLHANIALTPTPFPLEAQFPYRIVSDAIDFMNESDGRPFLLQVGFSEPHDPEQVPTPYWNMYPPESVPGRCAGPEALKQLGYRAQWEYGHQQAGFPTEQNWRRYKSNYLGMLRLLDDQLARLVTFMNQKDLLRKTIIVYVADHGDYLMDYGLARKGVGMPECLSRIPMVWSGPGITSTSVGQSAFVSMADLFPTFCEIMNTSIPHGVQGRSLWPLLRGETYPRDEFRSIYQTVGLGGLYYEASDHVPYFLPDGPRASPKARAHPMGFGFDELNKVTQSGLQKMVRMGDWKLIYDMMGYGQLYHLPSDPCELRNLFGQPHVATEQASLMAELLMWTIRSQDSLPTGPQNLKYQTKWPGGHNWYEPYRHGTAPEPFIP